MMQLVLISPLLLFLSARQCNANLIGAAALVQSRLEPPLPHRIATTWTGSWRA